MQRMNGYGMQRRPRPSGPKRKINGGAPMQRPGAKRPAPSKRPGATASRGPAPIGRGGQRRPMPARRPRPMPKGRVPARTPKRPGTL